MNGEDIIGYLIKLLEEQEQIKITYSLGGNRYDGSEFSNVQGSQGGNSK
jgi:hypothetical protein